MRLVLFIPFSVMFAASLNIGSMEEAFYSPFDS